jgi:hypothetical protein
VIGLMYWKLPSYEAGKAKKVLCSVYASGNRAPVGKSVLIKNAPIGWSSKRQPTAHCQMTQLGQFIISGSLDTRDVNSGNFIKHGRPSRPSKFMQPNNVFGFKIFFCKTHQRLANKVDASNDLRDAWYSVIDVVVYGWGFRR